MNLDINSLIIPLKRAQKKIVNLTFIIILLALIAILSADKFLITNQKLLKLNQNLANTQKELDALKNQDQYKINKDLIDKMQKSQDAYNKTILSYQKIVDLRDQKQNTSNLDNLLAQVLSDLSKLNYASAQEKLTDLNSQIDKANATLARNAAPAGQTTTAAINNSPPGSGYSYQAVKNDQGTFNIAIIAADLNSTRVIIDTASDSDCSNNCPVLPLGTYAARSGAFAAINGSFSVQPSIQAVREKQIPSIRF